MCDAPPQILGLAVIVRIEAAGEQDQEGSGFGIEP